MIRLTDFRLNKLAALIFASLIIFFSSNGFAQTYAQDAQPKQDLSASIKSLENAVNRQLSELEFLTTHAEGTRNSTYSTAKRLIDLRKIAIFGLVIIIALLLTISFQLRGISRALSRGPATGFAATQSTGSTETQSSANEDVEDEKELAVSPLKLALISFVLFAAVTVAIIYVALSI